MNKLVYKKIYIIQSYPNLIHLVNLLYDINEKIAVIISLDYRIYKFLKKLNIPNVDLYKVGSAIVYRRSYFYPIRTLHTKYIWKTIPNLITDELIITYYNWCDVGALYISKIEHNKLIIYVPYTEERYSVVRSKKNSLNKFQKFINRKTGGFIESKDYLSTINNIEIKSHGVGLISLENNTRTQIKYIPQINSVDQKAINVFEVKNKYYLFIDKEIVKSKYISWIDSIILYYKISKTFKKKKIDLAFKFKPRHFDFKKFLILKLFGFKILPTESPSELFATQKNCIGIIGFTSSSMSVNYNKKTISIATLENTFKINMNLNVESMEQRNKQKTNIIYLKNINELDYYLNEF